MERGLTMLLHSAVIAFIAYLFMIYIMGQNKTVAENHSLILGAIMLIYMILFGHGIPTKLNKGIF